MATTAAADAVAAMEEEQQQEEEGTEGEARTNRKLVGEYELQRLVGKGSFAKVFRAAHRRTGARVAVKAIDRELVDKRVHEGILQEREILNSISHPNILRLLDTIDVRNPLLEPPFPSATVASGDCAESSMVNDVTTVKCRVVLPQTGKVLYLVLEYCDGGDLDSFLNKHGRLPEATAKDLMRQLGIVLMRL
jgi:serine/threonine-protein kinase ULK2